MNRIILILLVFASFNLKAQETEFKFTKEGFTDYVVNSIEGKTAQELYNKTLDWINVTYKNPNSVIKAKIENEYIRIEGVSSKLLCVKTLGLLTCNDAKYQIEISFKDGKYKFDLIKLEEYIPQTKYTYNSGWSDISLTNTTAYYKENGDIKNLFKLYPAAIEGEFNSLNKSLNDFIKSESIPSKKSDW